MKLTMVIHKDADSCYGVSFPDYEGCFSAGDTLEEAALNGIEALKSYLKDEQEELNEAIAARKRGEFVEHDLIETGE